MQFVKTVNLVVQEANQDDPYAEYFLFKLDDLLVEVKEKLRTVEFQLKKYFDELKGVEVSIYESATPVRYRMHFHYPPSYMGGFLLGDVDYIFRLALTLKKFGVYLGKDEFSFRAMHQMFRRLYQFPRKWVRSGVTRKDILENTPLALEAKKLMGKVPGAILEKKIRLPYLPKLEKNTTE